MTAAEIALFVLTVFLCAYGAAVLTLAGIQWHAQRDMDAAHRDGGPHASQRVQS